MSRLETMAERIKKDLPEFVELISPTPTHEGLYRRIRHIQMTGKCCGYDMSLDQLREIIALAGRESVRNPFYYLCAVLDKLHVERTLKTANSRLKIDERIKSMGHYVRLEAEWQVKYISALIYKKFSMDDLMTACEIAEKKKYPSHYLIKLLQRGFKAANYKPRFHQNYEMEADYYM